MTDLSEMLPVQVLLVEDSPGDANLTRQALKSAKVANELHVAVDGEAALRFLRGEGPYAEMPRPDLVLLDLNLPRMDGREVLEQMKADPGLRSIPVIVLTTSSDEADVLRSYDLHANAYVTKPVAFSDFVEALKAIEGFWLEIVRLPRH
ncbi:MAG: response regulator [Candidatus Dormibacteria bacterium]